MPNKTIVRCFTKGCNKPRLMNGDVFCQEHYDEWLEFEENAILRDYDLGARP